MTPAEPRISPLGDAGLVVTFGNTIDLDTHREVMAFAHHLDSSPPRAMVEYIPAFTSVTLLYDPLVHTYDEFTASVRTVLNSVTSIDAPVVREPVDIPVCYGGELGPDLDFVAAHNDLEPEEVVELHAGEIYVVYMIGFAPGFPYLGGLSPRITAPRLEKPRAVVPAGSVGIAGSQTGIYPLETPGGWRLIGRSPARLFRTDEEPPALLKAGDRVRFVPTPRSEYDAATAREDSS